MCMYVCTVYASSALLSPTLAVQEEVRVLQAGAASVMRARLVLCSPHVKDRFQRVGGSWDMAEETLT